LFYYWVPVDIWFSENTGKPDRLEHIDSSVVSPTAAISQLALIDVFDLYTQSASAPLELLSLQRVSNVAISDQNRTNTRFSIDLAHHRL